MQVLSGAFHGITVLSLWFANMVYAKLYLLLALLGDAGERYNFSYTEKNNAYTPYQDRSGDRVTKELCKTGAWTCLEVCRSPHQAVAPAQSIMQGDSQVAEDQQV